jgi:hypothetical protein
VGTQNLVRVGLVVLWAVLFLAYMVTHAQAFLVASVLVIVAQVIVASLMRRR